MNKELIIQSAPAGIEIALLEDKKLVELHYDNSGGEFNVGDLYLGKIKKVMPGLNAVFVDIGFEKDAFLHYTDLSPHFNSILKFTQMSMANNNLPDFGKFTLEEQIDKSGIIAETIKGKPNILVQVIKEPISNKGPRITCELSLPGRFIVMMPFNNSVNISRKISSNDERKRLEKIIKSIKTDNFGIIVRTAAEGQSTADLHKDLLSLIEAWKNIQNNLFESTAPSKILSEQNKTTSLLRDLLSDDFNTIIANDEAIVKSAKEYISSFAPEKENMVQLHKNGASIFEHFGINKQVKSSFGKTVMLNSGGYLIIEHTEALTVIDVNSGHKFSGENQEATALNCNMEAIKEIARQLRLRDIGGIIVVDLIDMRSADNRKAVSDAMFEFMKSDRAKHNTLQISKFGLLQITRQRLRPATKIITSEVCPSCQGSGKVRSSQVLIDDIEKHVKYLTSHIKNTLILTVHPIVYGYLTKGFFSTIYRTWKKKYGKFGLQENNDLEYIQYKFSDSSTDEEIKF